MAATRTPGVREGNLADVLRLVHTDGPLSRAALTRHTGLNRSTVADLVGALAGDGLVVERDPRPSRRVGRPSPVVEAAPRVVAVAVNPEVDALTVAVVGLDRGIRTRVRLEYDTPPAPGRAAELIAGQLVRWRQGLLGGARVVGVGLAVPGLVRARDGRVHTAPHLDWADVALADLVGAACGIPAVVGNDANLGALAEHLFGAARGVADVVYLNGGAGGIGGGIILGGMPVTGASGYAGEFGHRRAVAADADRRSPDGTLEDEVSRRLLLEAAGLPAIDDDGLVEVIGAAYADAGEVGGGAADGHDADLAGLRVETARQRRILAAAVADVAGSLNPAVVVLGGFLAAVASVDADGFAADVRARCAAGTAEAPDVRSATLAADRLLIGAAEVAFAPLLADPTAG